jgi:sodium/hydrogen antiporter
LAFGLALLGAVLVSDLARKTPLSTAVLFLVAGFVAGRGGLDVLVVDPADPAISRFIEIALVGVLFSDGLKIGVRDLAAVGRLSGRALLLGMPLTLIIMALLTRTLAGTSWQEAFLLAAVLSPTDPVFASAIVTRTEIPRRLRRLINVESGLNDGLALPLVLILLTSIAHDSAEVLPWLGELALGVGLGVAIPWVILRVAQGVRSLGAAGAYRPLFATAILIVVYASASLLNGNTFLAAFISGITVASAGPDTRDSALEFVEVMAELLKLGALLLLGSLLTLGVFTQVRPVEYLLVLLLLAVARPAALLLVLAGSSLNMRERVTAAWFGPRGFASVVYGLLVARSGVPRAEYLFHLITLVIVASILTHSSTDVLFARLFRKSAGEGDEADQDVDAPDSPEGALAPDE